MIRITVQDEVTGAAADIRIPSEQGPALRSALAEIRNEVGERLAGSHRFTKEHALTNASAALGSLCATVNTVIPNEDPEYE